MPRIALTATIARIEPRPAALFATNTDLVLCDVLDADGFPLPDGLRLTYTGTLRALALVPGDRLALGGHLGAFVGTRRIAEEVLDVVAFLRSLPRTERVGVYFRLVRPSGVRRIRPAGATHQ